MKKGVLIFLIPFSLFAQVKEISLNTGWKFRKEGSKEWLPATVPGTVHTDLLTNKKIAHPFSPGAEKELQWIDTCNWEYKTVFTANPEMLTNEADLVFEGLDTYTAVYLNDSLVLQADNMFRSWKINAKGILKKGKNELRVNFTSAVKRGKELAAQLPYTLPEGERVFTRKAQFHYGWDFAPRFVTCGIWKNVKLVLWRTAQITNLVAVTDSITTEKAILNFRPEINFADGGNYEFILSCKEHKGVNSILNTYIEPGRHEVSLEYKVPYPKLWWCRGMGEPFLYHFTISVKKQGVAIDNKEIRYGIRTIELMRDSDAVGQSFYFKVNNKPVFMKGANLVPPDVFLPRVTNETYSTLINLATRADMNMLRVWGGGVYCPDKFYDLCDEKGLLVWQDLMFACAMYPGDKAFTDNVREEVKEQAVRLSSHPCLALWCGNNESDEGWKNWGWQKKFNYSFAESDAIYNNYRTLFTKTVPEVYSQHYEGGSYNYVHSSPQYGWGREESMRYGDSHYWGVWWGMEPFEIYTKKTGRFMSEYGFQGMPGLSCIKEYVQYNSKPDSAKIKSYQKHPKGFETIDTYLQRDYKMPNEFENYVYVSQLVQARGLQTAIEAHRRNKPRCMGSLYWQLNDCWSGITWSSIDHSANPKAAWYAAKRTFRDVLVSFTEVGDSIQLWITTDVEDRDIRSVVKLKLCDFSGNITWSKELQVEIKAGSSKNYFTVSKKILGSLKKEQAVLKASMNTLDGSIKPAEAFYYFVSPKDLALEKAVVTVSHGATSLELSTNTLAKNIFMDMGQGVTFSDNYFDLLPGEPKIIYVIGNPDPKALIKIISLADAN